MDSKTIVKNATEKQRIAAIQNFLFHYLTPAFGTLPKAEVDLLVLNLLEDLGVFSNEPNIYELVTKLKITRSKARNLIYQRELRSTTFDQLEKRVLAILQRPLIQKSGELFVLEIENPLVADHLRDKVKNLGYVSDGSFSPNIVRLSIDAITALLESNFTEQQKIEIQKLLIVAGAPDTSFKGVLKATLKKVASKVADNTGEEMIEQASAYMKPLVEGAVGEIKSLAKELFSK